MPFLENRDLAKTYRNAEVPVPVLSGLTLDVERARCWRSSARPEVGNRRSCTSCFYRPDSVSSRIGDKLLTKMGAHDLLLLRNRYVGFVFQFHHLLPDVRERGDAGMDRKMRTDRR